MSHYTIHQVDVQGAVHEYRWSLLKDGKPVGEIFTQADAETIRAALNGELLRLFLCERCVEEHARNTQSISCYCDCHSSNRDEANWKSVRTRVLAALPPSQPTAEQER